MSKELSEMTLEELWQLFPIILSPHNDEWLLWFEEEEKYLRKILVDYPTILIHHIGSTAIPFISAKPTVDILIETKDEKELQQVAHILSQNHYPCMAQTLTRIDMNKGYTKNGFAKRVFHLHLRIKGDHDELFFRDYLIKHPKLAKEYEDIKKELAKKYVHHRDAYTDGKTEFVKKITELAKKDTTKE